MAEVKTVKINVDTKGAVDAMENLSKATHDVSASFEEVYGDLQPLTTRMGEAEDRLYELANAGQTATQEYKDLLKTVGDYRKVQIQTDLAVDSAATTMAQKLGGALGGISAGYSLAQGVMGTFGIESERVEKTLVRIQSAMAISQGVQGLKEAIPTFKQLGTVAMDALKGIRTGIAATGIGVFLVAIGTIVAYWDDIKAAVSGVSDEQERLNKQTELNVLSQQAKLDSLNGQDNILKLQGKSEKEILELKLSQTDAVLLATQAQLEQQENTKKAEVAAAKRNFDILKMIARVGIESAVLGLRILAAPIDAVLETANAVSDALGFGKITTTNINKEISKLTESASAGIAKLIFNPQEVAAESNAAIKETKASITKLKNEKAGLMLSIRAIDKQDRQQATKEKKEDVKKEEEEIELIKRESGLKSINNLQKQRDAELEVTKKALEEEAKLREEAAQKELERQAKLQEDKSKLVYDSLNLISEITSLFGQKNERVARAMFNIDKAARLASATMSAREGVINAFKTAQDSPLTTVFPAYPFVQAGLAGAFGAVNIAKIASQKFQASGGASDLASGGGGGTGGVSSAAPSFNVVGNSGLNQLAQIQQTPVQAYVVSGEVTSAQALDRNRIKNATL